MTLNKKQRIEAGKRLKLLGYPKEVQDKYLDEGFLEKLQEAQSNDVPQGINIAPFLKMEEDEGIFTYLYRYDLLPDGRLQLRLFFVNNKEQCWEQERALLKSAMEKGIDTEDAKEIFRTFVRPLAN